LPPPNSPSAHPPSPRAPSRGCCAVTIRFDKSLHGHTPTAKEVLCNYDDYGFGVITPCSTGRIRRFGGTLSLCSRQKSKFGEPPFLWCLLSWDFLSTLKMEVICYFQTLDVSEVLGVNTHIHCRKSLKSHILCSSTFEMNCPRMVETRSRKYTPSDHWGWLKSHA
jgi:hypothetical protein